MADYPQVLNSALNVNDITKKVNIVSESDGAGSWQTPIIIKDGKDETKGAKSDAAVTDPTLSASEIALLKGVLKQMQGTGSGSMPVQLNGSNGQVISESNPFPVKTDLNISSVTATDVEIKNVTLQEQKTQADAINNIITFSDNIRSIGIYHEESTWQTFIVNGLSLKIPAGGWSRPIGGTPSANVTIPSGINCIVERMG